MHPFCDPNAIISPTKKMIQIQKSIAPRAYIHDINTLIVTDAIQW